MSRDIKVYFDRRILILSDDIYKHIGLNDCLFVNCGSVSQLANLLFFFQSASIFQSLCLINANPPAMLEGLKEHFTFIKAAGGLVKNRQDEYLLIKRNGLWDLPKGKAERGESSEQTALREVTEECGVTGPSISWHITDTYHTYKQKDTHFLKKTSWYMMEVCQLGTLTPQTEEGITEAKWVAKSNIYTYLQSTYPSICEVFEATKG